MIPMKFGFRMRIMTTMYLIAVVCVIIIALLSYSDSKKTIQENYVHQLEEKMALLAASFDSTMQEVYQSTQYISCMREIRECIKTYLQSEQGYMEGVAVSQKLQNLQVFDQLENTLCLYLPECRKVFSSQEYYTARDVEGEIAEVWEDHSAAPFVPLYFENQFMKSSHKVYAYMQPVNDEDGSVLGFVWLMIDERQLYYQLLDYVNNTDEENYMLLSSSGMICSAENISDLGDQLEGVVENQNHRVDIEAGEDGILYSSMEAPFTKYRILCQSDLGLLMKDIKQHTIYMIFMIILVFTGLIFITQIAAGYLYRPVKELSTEKEEARINALQYQIRPHFMYNTLNSIRFAAALQKNDKLAEMLGDFIALLEASTQRNGAFILLREEISLVKSYLSLQSFRYFECFETVFEIEKEAEECYVPCLLLQPIVENAVFHGINPTENNNLLEISAFIRGQQLHIIVSDNGDGFSVEQLEKEQQKDDKRRLTGIGMQNVMQRLKLYYGDASNLTIQSENGKGTTVTFVLPVSFDPEEYSIRKREVAQ